MDEPRGAERFSIQARGGAADKDPECSVMETAAPVQLKTGDGCSPRQLTDQIQEFLRDFALNPMNSASKLRSLLAGDARSFYRAAIEALAQESELGPGARAVAKMIASEERFLDELEVKAASDLPAAIQVGRHLLDADRSVTQALLYRVNAAQAQADLERANRLLSVVGTMNQGVRNIMPLVPLTSVPESRIRSKAMLLVGKVVRRAEWLKKALSDTDARVRANGIEATWGGVSEDLIPLLEDSLNDGHPRVVGNAVVALIQAGSERGIEHLHQMTQHANAGFRATAAWVIGHLALADFLPSIKVMLSDKDPLVFRNALRASVKLRQALKTAPVAPV
jgi:hypothetical protein